METFEVLADPIRRRIIELLADEERDAGNIAQHFSISRPAVSRHLRILREAHLVKVRHAAQHRVYRLNPAPLSDIDRWLARYRRFWTDRLDRLDQHVQQQERR